jgi:ankyrin repeat protein
MSSELIEAAERNDFLKVRKLVTEGANIHHQNDLVLRWGAYHGNLEMVKFLILKGADVHAKDGDALYWATRMERLEVAKYLISQGVNPHKTPGLLGLYDNAVTEYIKSLAQKSKSGDESRWNTICSQCNSPAYRGFVDFECSKGCE